MHLVALGFGISIASEAATATRYPEVVFRPLATAEDMLPYSAVWLPGNDNPALRRFLSLARSLASGSAGAGRAEVGFLTLRSLANARSPAMKRASIGATSLAGSIVACPGFAAQGIGIGDEIAVYRRRQLDRQLDRLVVGDRAEFQLCHRSPPQP